MQILYPLCLSQRESATSASALQKSATVWYIERGYKHEDTKIGWVLGCFRNVLLLSSTLNNVWQCQWIPLNALFLSKLLPFVTYQKPLDGFSRSIGLSELDTVLSQLYKGNTIRAARVTHPYAWTWLSESRCRWSRTWRTTAHGTCSARWCRAGSRSLSRTRSLDRRLAAPASDAALARSEHDDHFPPSSQIPLLVPVPSIQLDLPSKKPLNPYSCCNPPNPKSQSRNSPTQHLAVTVLFLHDVWIAYEYEDLTNLLILDTSSSVAEEVDVCM